MKDKEKSIKSGITKCIIAGVALTAISLIVIPPLVENCGSKLYKKSLEKDEIDFDNMGPEIVPFEK